MELRTWSAPSLSARGVGGAAWSAELPKAALKSMPLKGTTSGQAARSVTWLAALLLGFSSTLSTTGACAADQAKPVDFDRDIRPILSDNCFSCHGPDANKRDADLRLDTKEGLFAERDGYHMVTPGKAATSELFKLVSTEDDFELMPPSSSNLKLTPSQVELVRRWIDEGASYSEHWAYVAPKRPEVPEVKERGWVRNPIDSFILARLEAEGLRHSPEVDRATLLRRVSFDLTGLPPTPEEVTAFLKDRSSVAYEKQVDRLLASPRYGEHMARLWLDLARYGDSHGDDADFLRGMWPWRDWVINAYNRNLPYDQFTIKQLAGDLLPDATLEDRIATGFNRNNVGFASEGDESAAAEPVDDETRANYTADRVSTVGTTWLGMTVGCARCHDHKYDPIKQKDFYRLAAYFNNIPEFTKGDYNGNTAPAVAVPSVEQQKQIATLGSQIRTTLARFPEKDVVAQENQWRATTAAASIPPPPQEGLVAYYEFEQTLSDGSGKGHEGHLQRGHVEYLDSVVGKGGLFNGAQVDFGNVGDFDRTRPFALSLWVNPRLEKRNMLQKRDGSPNWAGLEIALDDPLTDARSARIVLRLASHWPDDAIEIRSKERVLISVPFRIRNLGSTGQHLVVNYDGSGKAAGLALYVDGRPVEIEITRDRLTGNFKTPASLSIGDEALGPPFAGLMDELRIYNRMLSAADVENLRKDVPALALVKALRDKPTAEIPIFSQRPNAPEFPNEDDPQPQKLVEAVWEKRQQVRLSDYFLSRAASEPIREAYGQLQQLRAEKLALEKAIPTTMVMAESPKPIETYVLGRGQYYNKTEKVTPGVPSFLLPLPKDAPANRLALAQWLVDSKNPMTARVEVNRYWQHYFGIGIVRTAEDFGAQGERPSHKQLLDWLATEFIRTGWDIKAMQRLIVLSATYRQSSKLTPELREKDPENRLLARGPRVRLSAEEIRDSALSISGLLASDQIGGPSVYPYQPPGVGGVVKLSTGPDLYRRSLYTIWRRGLLIPSFVAFDAPDRLVCVARRTVTNTPLQALTLMDDPTYVEAGRGLAQRAIHAAGRRSSKRLDYLYAWALERQPNSQERKLLAQEAQRVAARFRQDPQAAQQLLAVGDTKADPKIDPAELAAWTTVARTVLNMDETITKQ